MAGVAHGSWRLHGIQPILLLWKWRIDTLYTIASLDTICKVFKAEGAQTASLVTSV